MSEPRKPETGAPHGVPFAEAVAVWARVAALSFGGPAGQIALMHRILVEEKRWIGETRFLHALNFCMLLPGPEAQQLTVYLGWLMHRTLGGVVAGTLFVLPGFLSILALSYVYVLAGDATVIEGLFFGLKAAVVAIVLQALLRIGARALGTPAKTAVAAAAFVGLFVFDVPFPLIVVGAALAGYLAARAGSTAFAPGNGGRGPAGGTVADADTALGAGMPAHARPDLRWSLSISAAFLALWLVPVAALWLMLGAENVFTLLGVFFSQMAVLTFGGAYAVLAWVAQEAVQNYGWLMPGEMLDGLGMAESTPGPLIQVVQFVGFLGAFREPGGLDPLLAATLGAVLVTWVTFVPCFLWIFLGAPFVEALRANVALAGALAAITAAVVGVIANLALWFAIHVLFRDTMVVDAGPLSLELPVLSSVDPGALALTAAAIAAAMWLRLPMLAVLGGAAAAGMVAGLAGLL